MSDLTNNLEEPVTCLDCGLHFEAENVIHSSLDAYGPLDETFCPRCGQDQLRFERPDEEKNDEEISRS